MPTTTCKQCGIEFKFIRKGKKNNRKFCDRNCFNDWRKEQRKKDWADKKSLLLKKYPSGIKKCNHCKTEKSLEEFHFGGNQHLLHAWCKKCLYKHQMIRWNKQKIKAIKYLGGKCEECGGVFHPSIYDFHHKEPDTKEVEWSKLRIKSWDKIQKEIDKCELLCGNCHRLRHIRKELW